MIEVENLTKRYGDVTAVRSISFSAEPGQVTGFLGPNGAGKTTTMRMLTGYTPPSSGTAVVAGHDVFEDSMAVRREVGYLPESVPLYRDMSAVGYLKYLAEIRGLGDRKTLAMNALERVGLANRAESRIRTLSKGMKQRVGLAAAILHDPAVLILDEPTIGLDPFQVLELRDLVQELGRDHTVLFSTHILSEAEQVCDKVVIINQGQIIGEGTPAELRARMERGQRILVRLADNRDTAESLLSQMAIVEQVVLERDALIVTPNTDEDDIRARLTRELVNNNLDVLEVRPAANNLEEIFLELNRQTMQPGDSNALPFDSETDTADADNEREVTA
jgi:ABC-2 type transport system ATP-binding protein